MVLGEAFHRRVVSQLTEHLESVDKQALLVFEPANVRYVTGVPFVANDRPIAACVWRDGRTALLVPQQQAEYAASGWIRDIRWYAEYPAEESPLRWMAREAGSPLLIDSVSAAGWRGIVEEVEDVDLTDVLSDLRAIKSPVELDLIERAASFADLALERAFARLTTGTAEHDALSDVVANIDAIMRSELGDLYDAAGQPITGSFLSGTRAAFPNAPASTRRLTRGDSVVVEFTTSVGGYHASAGSTFFVGDPLRDVVRWVEAAMAAQTAVREAMAPGKSAESVDTAARKSIDRMGLSTNLRHGAGHGIGLQYREAPWLVRSQDTKLREGMVLVNHPGVYIQGRTGARNTETVVIEEEGPRVLNPRIRRWNDIEARLKEF